MKLLFACSILVSLVFSPASFSQTMASVFDDFEQVYTEQLGSTKGCDNPQLKLFKVCSSSLKNAGNAPYILHHEQKTAKVMVLFHGLSDSPFFFQSIARSLHQQGFNVLVALLPGHGLKEADAVMQNAQLANMWREHVDEIMTLAQGLGEQLYIGGFSTGGALAVEYTLKHPQAVQAILLFSGALALKSSFEFMANIWGIQWFTKLLDSEYQTIGRNPYKYPKVSRFAALELLEVIFSVRHLLEQSPLNHPIFAAHSEADNTTLISGVKNLMQHNQGANVLFVNPKEVDVCHADVVISEAQLQVMNYDDSNMLEVLPCDVPKANPQHAQMLAELQQFMAKY